MITLDACAAGTGRSIDAALTTRERGLPAQAFRRLRRVTALAAFRSEQPAFGQ
jgi:hypothetical protein